MKHLRIVHRAFWLLVLLYALTLASGAGFLAVSGVAPDVGVGFVVAVSFVFGAANWGVAFAIAAFVFGVSLFPFHLFELGIAIVFGLFLANLLARRLTGSLVADAAMVGFLAAALGAIFRWVIAVGSNIPWLAVVGEAIMTAALAAVLVFVFAKLARHR